MSDAVIREIEASMESLKRKVAKAERLERLLDNPDFKEFIMEDFMGKSRIQDLLTKKVSPSFQDPANKLYIDTQMGAIGAFRMYLMLTEQEGASAKEGLAMAEDERNRAIEEANA